MSKTRIIGLACSCLTFLHADLSPASEPLRRTGEHFQLVCHVQNEKIADESLRTLEAVWPLVAATYQVEDKVATQRPTVHLYSVQSDYEEADRRLNGGAFRENLAFTQYESNSAHVLLQPPCTDEVLKVIGLPSLTRRLLAHEAVHSAGHALVDQYNTLPQWISDGAAISIAQAAMEKLDASQPPASEPYCSTPMQIAKNLRKSKKLATIADIMAGNLQNFERVERYALRWLCYEFIHKGVGEKEWGTAIQQSVNNPRKKWRRNVIKSFLASEPSADEGFLTYIKQLKPVWEEVYRSLETSGSEWTQIAFPEKNAICWRTGGIKKKAFEISGRAKILPAHAKQLNLVFGRNDQGFTSIALAADYGITVFRYKYKDNEWTKLADAKCDAVVAGSFFDFKVANRDGQLSIYIDSKKVLGKYIGNDSVAGPWGLGAQAGSTGIWSDVQISQGEAKTRPEKN